MTSSKHQRLELTWFNKDKALIPTENGKYGYSWVDPRDPRYCETHTLVEGAYIEGIQAAKEAGLSYSERADLEPTTDNLLINGESGDVLEALTRVPELADKYLGKIKLCYIDPPFNTAGTFTHYEDNLEHSVWLTMMRDRLVHIKKLLSDDGSIWVHLDDSENHRMRLLLDEVFGASNFIAEVVWQKADSPRNDAAGFSISHDSILIYSKNHSWRPNRVARLATTNTSRYKSRDGDPVLWRDMGATAPGASTHQGMVYAIQHPVTGSLMYPTPGRCWSLSQDRMLANMREYADYDLRELDDAAERARICGVSEGDIRLGVPAIMLSVPIEVSARTAQERYDAGTWPELVMLGLREKLQRKSHLVDNGRVPETIWTGVEVGGNLRGKKEIQALFPDLHPFATPKPEQLLERILHIATAPGDIVLDVFAGSGTTAAVAHKMSRGWVTVELLPATVEQFTLPRLVKVVRGEDPGGITSTEGERVDATEYGLPADLSAAEAFGLTQALGKIAKVVTAPVDLSKVVGDAVREDSKADEPMLDGDEAKELRRLMRKLAGSDSTETDFLPYVRKAAGDQLKTRKSPDTINWRGGGGFRVATLSPECFAYDPDLGLVTLTPEAFEGDSLARTVAAHMNFHLTPDDPLFTGKRGRTRILVTTADATPEYAAELVTHLGDDEKLVLASTSIDPDTQQALRVARRGSRVVHIPNDLFRVHEIEG